MADVAVHVHVEAGGPDRLTSASLLLNLLPRLFRKVSATGIDPSRYLPASHAAKIGAMRHTKPDFEFLLQDVPSSSDAATRLFVDSRGWSAYLSYERPCGLPRGTPNAISAFLAAALAVNEAFLNVFRTKAGHEKSSLLDEDFLFDVIELSRTKEPKYDPRVDVEVDLGSILLVGAGAVGQAFAAALAELPLLSGALRIVDPDMSDGGNEQRCVLAFPESRGQPKAEIVRNHLKTSHPLLLVGAPLAEGFLSMSMDYGAYRALTFGMIKEGVVVTTVDNAQCRRDVQAGLPKVIFDGWTETAPGLMAYGLGRFEAAGPYQCLACFHQPAPGVPDDAELAASRTGWPMDECRRRLADPSILTTEAEAEQVSKRLSQPKSFLKRYVGKPLLSLLHDECGLAAVRVDGQTVIAPVTHVPSVVGGLLAAHVIAFQLGSTRSKLANLAFFDAFRLPLTDHAQVRLKSPNCYCADFFFGTDAGHISVPHLPTGKSRDTDRDPSVM